jgi:hypothetical protein
MQSSSPPRKRKAAYLRGFSVPLAGPTHSRSQDAPNRAKDVRRDRSASPPAASECAASAHSVEAPIEALGCRTENKRGEDPPSSGTDENGHRRRQVDKRQRQSCPNEGARERHSGSD